MKKITVLFLLAVITVTLTACGNTNTSANANQTTGNDHTGQKSNVTLTIDGQPAPTPDTSTDTSPSSSEDAGTPDIDISGVGTNIIYQKALDISQNYQSYLGKIIKIKGNFKAEQAQTRNYYYCLVADPTACCNAGFEFVLKDSNLKYPNDYPGENAEFIVQGKLSSYKEGDNTYLELRDATLIKK